MEARMIRQLSLCFALACAGCLNVDPYPIVVDTGGGGCEDDAAACEADVADSNPTADADDAAGSEGGSP